jgi:hypothetical protein
MAGMHNMLLGLQAGTGGVGVVISTVDMVDPFGDGSGKFLLKFNGDATDAGGLYNGTATSITYSSGVFGECAVFNGSSSGIVLPTGMLTSSAFTLSYWFKTTTLSGSNENDEMQISFRNATKTIEIFTTTTGKISIGNWQGVGYAITLPTTITDGLFHNLVVSYTGTIISIYLDGILMVTQTYNMVSQAIGNAIGKIDSGTRYFTGSMDQMRYFNRALTEAEVTACYTETIAA